MASVRLLYSMDLSDPTVQIIFLYQVTYGPPEWLDYGHSPLVSVRFDREPQTDYRCSIG